jgi:photosystem II stability/assembly factor-like uncharacterized protein
MKTSIMMKYDNLIYLVVLALLLAACQMPSRPIETPAVTLVPTTQALATSTPTATPSIEPSPTTQSPTPDMSTGQVTPSVTPSESGDQVGWVMTDTAILRTTDGGASWDDITPDGIRDAVSNTSDSFGPVFATAFWQEDHALAALPQRDMAIIYRTSDGGQSWNETGLSFREEIQGITSMALIDAQHGWLLGTRGVGAGNDWVDLYFTEDGGASWGFLAGSDSETNPMGAISSGGIKSGLSFSSLARGWLTGSAPIEMVYLFRTLDGGYTWQPNHLPLPDGFSFSGSSYPPIFFDDQNGVLPATLLTQSDEPGLLFFETQDGGENWVPTVLLEGQVSTWDWLNSQIGYAAGTDDQMQSKLYFTMDGGRNWEAYLLEMPMIRSLDFVSIEKGWIICGWAVEPRENCSGDLYHTEDGGRNWERVYP